MKRFRNHLLAVDQGSIVLFSDFANNGPMWSGDGPRESQQKIQFGEVFLTAPMVQVAISMWDMGGDTNQRADLRAEKITPKGFLMVFRTWGDSRVARIRADWIAVGELADDDAWDVI